MCWYTPSVVQSLQQAGLIPPNLRDARSVAAFIDEEHHAASCHIVGALCLDLAGINSGPSDVLQQRRRGDRETGCVLAACMASEST